MDFLNNLNLNQNFKKYDNENKNFKNFKQAEINSFLLEGVIKHFEEKQNSYVGYLEIKNGKIVKIIFTKDKSLIIDTKIICFGKILTSDKYYPSLFCTKFFVS